MTQPRAPHPGLHPPEATTSGTDPATASGPGDIHSMRPGGFGAARRPEPRPGDAGTPGAHGLLFSAEEYEQRLAAVRRRMRDQGLSGLIVTDPANMFYLTGYNAWSFYTPQLLYVPASGPMTLFAREMDAHGAQRTCWLPEEDIVGYPERYVHRPHIHPFDWIAFALRQRWEVAPAAHGCIGVEMDSHYYSPRAHRALVHGIPEWTLVDSFELVNWIRAIKSPAEIAIMRQAAQVTTAAMNAALDAVEAGARQNDVAAAIAHAQAAGTAEVWGDFPAIVPMLPTGEGADTPHLTWTDRRLRSGEPVVIELAGAHHRYHVPLARTVMLGDPPAQLQHTADVVAEALNEVLETMRPDVPVAELARVWNAVLARYEMVKESRLGYSIGIGYPPDWGERTISLRSEDEQVLAAGMTFHVIAGMWLDGIGYEVSEPVAVTATGVECFTDFPRDLIRK